MNENVQYGVSPREPYQCVSSKPPDADRCSLLAGQIHARLLVLEPARWS